MTFLLVLWFHIRHRDKHTEDKQGLTEPLTHTYTHKHTHTHTHTHTPGWSYILIKINTILDQKYHINKATSSNSIIFLVPKPEVNSVKHPGQNLLQKLTQTAQQGPKYAHGNTFIVKGVEYQSLKLRAW